MSNLYQEMKENLDKLHQIRTSITPFTHEARRILREEVQKIESNRDLSSEGQSKQKELLRKDFGKKVLEQAGKLKQEYKEATVKAGVRAEMLLNEGPKKPDQQSLTSFERSFSSLKTELLLETNADTALRKINEFVGGQNDPYLASQILNDFSHVIQSVLDAAGDAKGKYKISLQDTLEKIRSNATSVEQKEAAEVYELMKTEFSKDLFLVNGIEFKAIQSDLGPDIANHLNNPSEYLARLEATEE
ncbi:hypothetical protein [Priestia koreensis]|uniref:hypothetical protein n=1 Tax=Priestia koreensis TaxID=284581 RepID=UPI0030167CA4